LLIGPNNSGKSVLVGTLQLFKHLVREPLVNQENGQWTGRWRSDDQVTADLFHKGCDAALMSVVFDVDLQSEPEIRATLLAAGAQISSIEKRIDVGIHIELTSQGTKQLISIVAGNIPIFVREASTKVITYNQSRPSYKFENPALGTRLFALPKDLSRRVVFFGAKRYLDAVGGNTDDIDALASGESLAGWIQRANNPAPQKTDDRERHAILRSFEKEFASFIGAKSININVSAAGIGLTLNDELIPISRLGTGIGECLTILLVCKIAGQSRQMPGMHICVLEEPELFLHPKLQRQLMELIQSYGVQLIATTHSPTVLDLAWRSSWNLFATHHDTETHQIGVSRVPHDGIGVVLNDLGVRPSDWLQSDGVLFVEGPTDVPVFKKWLSLMPGDSRKSIAVIPIGGRMTANEHFDFQELNRLGKAVAVIMDSERSAAGAEIHPSREKIRRKCADAGIPCLLTEKRATENYFPSHALKAIYGEGAVLGPFENLSVVKQATKDRNDEVAAAMTWKDLDGTDIGAAMQAFVGRLS
jgi:hypothetical protein